MRVLVAEDEPILLKTIRLRLLKDGHEVISTADGKEAIQEITHMGPDLVITDIMMPFSSGLEVLACAKQNMNKKIPVIILSAMGQEKVVVEAFKLGADDYMTKPFSPNELAMRVKRFEMKNVS